MAQAQAQAQQVAYTAQQVPPAVVIASGVPGQALTQVPAQAYATFGAPQNGMAKVVAVATTYESAPGGARLGLGGQVRVPASAVAAVSASSVGLSTKDGGKIFPEIDILLESIREGPMGWACPILNCKYSATQKRYLKAHMRTHNGAKPHRCDYPGCAYSSAYRGHLVRHKRNHSGEKPFACSWQGCDYRGRQSSHLQAHMQKHTNDRPWPCQSPVCDFSAPSRWHLQRHARCVHRGEDLPLERYIRI